MNYFRLFVAVEMLDCLVLFIIVCLQMKFDVFILDVDERSFLVGSKEHVFFVIVDPFEWLNAAVIEVRRTDISTASLSKSQVPLQKQVVSRGDVIMLIRFNASLCVF